MQQVALEHSFWWHGIDSILVGYKEEVFTKRFLEFMDNLDMGNVTKLERELIDSIPLSYNNISAKWQVFMKKFISEWDIKQKKEEEAKAQKLHSKVQTMIGSDEK